MGDCIQIKILPIAKLFSDKEDKKAFKAAWEVGMRPKAFASDVRKAFTPVITGEWTKDVVSVVGETAVKGVDKIKALANATGLSELELKQAHFVSICSECKISPFNCKTAEEVDALGRETVGDAWDVSLGLNSSGGADVQSEFTYEKTPSCKNFSTLTTYPFKHPLVYPEISVGEPAENAFDVLLAVVLLSGILRERMKGSVSLSELFEDTAELSAKQEIAANTFFQLIYIIRCLRCTYSTHQGVYGCCANFREVDYHKFMTKPVAGSKCFEGFTLTGLAPCLIYRCSDTFRNDRYFSIFLDLGRYFSEYLGTEAAWDAYKKFIGLRILDNYQASASKSGLKDKICRWTETTLDKVFIPYVRGTLADVGVGCDELPIKTVYAMTGLRDVDLSFSPKVNTMRTLGERLWADILDYDDDAEENWTYASVWPAYDTPVEHIDGSNYSVILDEFKAAHFTRLCNLPDDKAYPIREIYETIFMLYPLRNVEFLLTDEGKLNIAAGSTVMIIRSCIPSAFSSLGVDYYVMFRTSGDEVLTLYVTTEEEYTNLCKRRDAIGAPESLNKIVLLTDKLPELSNYIVSDKFTMSDELTYGEFLDEALRATTFNLLLRCMQRQSQWEGDVTDSVWGNYVQNYVISSRAYDGAHPFRDCGGKLCRQPVYMIAVASSPDHYRTGTSAQFVSHTYLAPDALATDMRYTKVVHTPLCMILYLLSMNDDEMAPVLLPFISKDIENENKDVILEYIRWKELPVVVDGLEFYKHTYEYIDKLDVRELSHLYHLLVGKLMRPVGCF